VRKLGSEGATLLVGAGTWSLVSYCPDNCLSICFQPICKEVSLPGRRTFQKLGDHIAERGCVTRQKLPEKTAAKFLVM
jgi:hypothetical protein